MTTDPARPKREHLKRCGCSFCRARSKKGKRVAHRKGLETMETKDLAKLLISMGPQHDEDDWFRELIVDEIKRRKP